MSSPLFQIIVTVGNDEPVTIDYRAIVEAIDDRLLADLLDTNYDATCEIWCGELKVSGKLLTTSIELHTMLVDNARTILHKLRP